MKKKLQILLFIAFSLIALNVACQRKDSTKKTFLIKGYISNTTQKFIYWNKDESHTEWNNSATVNFDVPIIKYTVASFSLWAHLNKNARATDYIYDYSYSIIRSKWQANSIAIGYKNFKENKYSNNINQFKKTFLTGFYFIEYYLPQYKPFANIIRIDESSNILPSISFEYAFKYFDSQGHLNKYYFDGKALVITSLKYTIAKNIYIEAGLNFYLQKETKQPWDSDYSYGFGINNYSANTFRFTYKNNINNSFPWNKTNTESGFFFGQFSIAYNFGIGKKQ